MTGKLRLQHCTDCGKVQYPPREICGNCLSEKLEWRETGNTARVLSFTRLHTSLEPRFQKQLPMDVMLVELDAGPVCYAFAAGEFAIGDSLLITERTDDTGKALLWAKA